MTRISFALVNKSLNIRVIRVNSSIRVAPQVEAESNKKFDDYAVLNDCVSPVNNNVRRSHKKAVFERFYYCYSPGYRAF